MVGVSSANRVRCRSRSCSDSRFEEPTMFPSLCKEKWTGVARLPACLGALEWVWCDMRSRKHSHLGGRMGPLVRLLMLGLGIVSVPSVGPAAMQRPHCAQHVPSPVDQDAHSGHTQQAPEPTPLAWESATEHSCPHCPASECARIAPCTTSSNAAIPVALLTVTQTVTHRGIVRRVRVHPYSTTHQPPIPPPQMIS